MPKAKSAAGQRKYKVDTTLSSRTKKQIDSLPEHAQHIFKKAHANAVKQYQDPYVNTVEAERLVLQIVTALHRIKDVFIIITSRLTDSQIEFPAMSRIEVRAKKELDETKLNLSIYNNGMLKKVSLMEAELLIDQGLRATNI
jgi:hypothetical protein